MKQLILDDPVQVIAGSMLAFTSKPKNKAVEDAETFGDPNRGTLGNSVNVHASQNINPMGGWPSPR